jgi:hypothetical protein
VSRKVRRVAECASWSFAAKIQTTLDLYTQEDGDETLAPQGEYLTALGVATQLVQ